MRRADSFQIYRIPSLPFINFCLRYPKDPRKLLREGGAGDKASRWDHETSAPRPERNVDGEEGPADEQLGSPSLRTKNIVSPRFSFPLFFL